MSGGRGKPLRARLDANDDVVCGRCGVKLAYVVTETEPGNSGWVAGESRRLLRFDGGWRLSDRDVWVLPPRAAKRAAAGLPAWRNAPTVRGRAQNYLLMGGAEPARLPVKAECRSCRSEQVLDPVTLNVPAEQRGDMERGWHAVPVLAVFDMLEDDAEA
ncbi:MAG: hypothetical protein H0V12_03070 [Chloroflexi bacterium]|nr:hypothetical protein [Chloroflexota bacterium]